jgi:hypothetical protein
VTRKSRRSDFGRANMAELKTAFQSSLFHQRIQKSISTKKSACQDLHGPRFLLTFHFPPTPVEFRPELKKFFFYKMHLIYALSLPLLTFFTPPQRIVETNFQSHLERYSAVKQACKSPKFQAHYRHTDRLANLLNSKPTTDTQTGLQIS